MAQMGGFGAIGAMANPAAAANVDNVAGGEGIRPFVRAYGTYNTNLSPAYVDQGGGLRSFDSFGVGAMVGLAGSKQFTAQTGIGVMYRAVYRHYERDKSLNAFSNVLSLGVSHRFTPRLTWSNTLLAGWSIGGFGFGSSFGGLGAFGGVGMGMRLQPGAVSNTRLATSFGNPEENDLVDNEALDVKTKFAAVTGYLSYAIDERWTATVGGVGFMVRRDNSLFGVNSYGARGSVSYQINSRSSIGLFAGQTRHDYPHVFGGVDGTFLALGYSRRLTNRSSLSVFGGAFYIRSEFVGAVPLDPFLAELLGTPTGLEIRKVNRLSYMAGARYSYDFHRSSLSAFFRRGMTPGNGFQLTGAREIAGVTYTYSGIEHWSFGSGVYASRTVDFFGNPSFISYTGRLSAGYHFHRAWHLTMSAGARTLNLETRPNRSQAFAMIGISWSPGDLPMPFDF